MQASRWTSLEQEQKARQGLCLSGSRPGDCLKCRLARGLSPGCLRVSQGDVVGGKSAEYECVGIVGSEQLRRVIESCLQLC